MPKLLTLYTVTKPDGQETRTEIKTHYLVYIKKLKDYPAKSQIDEWNVVLRKRSRELSG
jgi:hypothetical protein